jgi:hypothetical protein
MADDLPADVDAGSGSGSGDDEDEDGFDVARFWKPIGYALGYLTVVVGVSRLPRPAGVAFVVGGIAILPPTRWLLGRPFGKPFVRWFMAVLYVVFLVVGVALFAFL